MLESVLIQNFKGFKNTSIGPFRKVNLLIGGQNVGKTSVMEAINMSTQGGLFTSFRPSEGNDASRFVSSVMNVSSMRISAKFSSKEYCLTNYSLEGNELFSPLSNKLLISSSSSSGSYGNTYAYGDEQAAKSLRPRIASIPLFLPDQIRLVNLFGRVILLRKRREIMELLRTIEPRLLGLDAISPDGEQRIYAEIEGVKTSVPLPEMGHGFSRLIQVFSEILVSEAELALIDEIENGIHYSALPVLFKGIKAMAIDGCVQSVITTHSWDCLRAACEAFEDTPELFQVIRLERHDDDVKAVCIDGERMLRLMAEEREVR